MAKKFVSLFCTLLIIHFCFGQKKCDSTQFYAAVDLYQHHEIDKAIVAYTKQLQSCPAFTEAYINRGVCYFNNGAIAKGESDFRKAVDVSPEKALTLYQVGNFYLGARQFDTAFIIFKSILSIDPKNSDAYFKMARSKWLKRIQELKIAHQDSDYTKDPVFAGYLKAEIIGYFNKAIALDSVVNFSSYANRSALAAAQDADSHYDYYYFRAVVKQNFEEYAGALLDYETSLMIHPTINARYYAALLAKAVKQPQKACDYMQQWAHMLSITGDESMNPFQKETVANKFCKELGVTVK